MAGAGPERIALTGATGFVGSRLLAALRAQGPADVAALVRRPGNLPPDVAAVGGDLSDANSLDRLCAGIATVFHCGGYAHAIDDGNAGFADLHRRINFEGTRNLAEAAGRAGVRCFVHLSSVKAMADPGDQCVDEAWPGEPVSAYGKAKRAAEDAVLDAGARFGMDVVNLRLAMVYGPGGERGNLDRMARLIRDGWFPPLPETMNRRSLIYVDDVVDAMLCVAADRRASGRTYIVAEEVAYSGRRIYELLCQALGVPVRQWSVPATVLRAAGRTGDLAGLITRRRLPLTGAMVERLLGSAWYSPSLIERELGWRANVSLAAGLARTYAATPR